MTPKYKTSIVLIMCFFGFSVNAQSSDVANEAVKVCLSSSSSEEWHNAFKELGWTEVTIEQLDRVARNLTAPQIYQNLRAMGDNGVQGEPIPESTFLNIYEGYKTSIKTKLENETYTGFFLRDESDVIVSLSLPINQRSAEDNLVGAHLCQVQIFNDIALNGLVVDDDMKKQAVRRGFPAGFSISEYPLSNGKKASVSGTFTSEQYWSKIYTKANTGIPHREVTVFVFP